MRVGMQVPRWVGFSIGNAQERQDAVIHPVVSLKGVVYKRSRFLTS